MLNYLSDKIYSKLQNIQVEFIKRGNKVGLYLRLKLYDGFLKSIFFIAHYIIKKYRSHIQKIPLIF